MPLVVQALEKVPDDDGNNEVAFDDVKSALVDLVGKGEVTKAEAAQTRTHRGRNIVMRRTSMEVSKKAML